MVKLDLGCGKTAIPGFKPVDIKAWTPKHQALDLSQPWPWKDGSVDEVHCRNLIHLFTMPQRSHFMHELHRVLKKGAQARVIVPHWACNMAYADPAVQWPPVAEGWFFHLNAEWREKNAPWCDFS